MKLSHTYFESQYFQYPDFETFLACSELSEVELAQANQLNDAGLPPITGNNSLAILLGIHRGFIWSLLRRPRNHYRVYDINTGTKTRTIYAPRIGLKILQKWLGTQFEKHYERPEHVFGFVKGLSHLDAAKVHLNASWVISVDIKNFFQSTSNKRVQWRLKALGFSSETATMLTKLMCIEGGLAQGSPASPVLSNFCATNLDRRISSLARKYNCRLSRYADDITFSGPDEYPNSLLDEIKNAIEREGWEIANHKTRVSISPNRLKIHGILVNGNRLKLTKGYRNKLRAYSHIQNKEGISEKDKNKLRGHLNYGKSIDKFNEEKL